MRQSLHLSPALFLSLATLLVGAGCHHHRHRDVVPVFQETEINDTPDRANHFGILRRGDHFFIDGFIDDALTDIDGFAFTAGDPLHVDFQLFTDSPSADLDVCLYDPALDEVLACFATPNEPERGGVDVFAGGLDFHLAVESFVGVSTYSLEIVVQPLFTLNAEQELALAQAQSEGRSLGLAASDAERAPERPEPDATRRYKRVENTGDDEVPELELEENTQVFVDEETDTVFAIQFRRLTAPRANASPETGKAPDGELR